MTDSMMPVEVHADIAKSFPKEYIEAVVTQAVKILPSYQHRQDTLVVLNPRRGAVIFDNVTHRGAVISENLIEQLIDGPMKLKLQTWMASPADSLLRHAHCWELVCRIGAAWLLTFVREPRTTTVGS